MELRRRFWLVQGVVLLVLVAGYVLFQVFDVEFLDFVVERTVVEKLGAGVSPESVHKRFAVYRTRVREGRLSRRAYRDALLGAAGYVEKVEVLGIDDLDRIGRLFEGGAP